ncbi:hypothetical protein OD91_0264 [Lutibacter sp. Hel_I_33_5]|uniref:DUF1853 family protein n=1 Tax=Lutibacter sp. Hel_I_33_5 TaxID=1566289 RepID=UPI0011A5393B|nr:DUF1853 family protein [Lutibacter sp. Hel_I_33_5]TVZ55023.1 hypothetical protein OD91_0264 [Lutibacter sp. Hel_I_33_5]
MHQKSKLLQKRYEGYLQTNCLWKGNAIYELNQFELNSKSIQINLKIDEKLRLGKYIERLVSFELQQKNNISIVCENIQIQQEKITLGELDSIILKDKKPIHLEIIYKFYLYDDSIDKDQIECFIGPNKKDSLVEKLNKLKEKQLPLLYSKECKKYLKEYNLKPKEVEQQVYFKAQLFVPYSNQNIQLKKINPDCIIGFYINLEQIQHFKNYKFYIPNKKDWLIIPFTNIDWLGFSEFKEITKSILERQFSPLCWLKEPNGEIKKIFLVWW